MARIRSSDVWRKSVPQMYGENQFLPVERRCMARTSSSRARTPASSPCALATRVRCPSIFSMSAHLFCSRPCSSLARPSIAHTSLPYPDPAPGGAHQLLHHAHRGSGCSPRPSIVLTSAHLMCARLHCGYLRYTRPCHALECARMFLLRARAGSGCAESLLPQPVSLNPAPKFQLPDPRTINLISEP